MYDVCEKKGVYTQGIKIPCVLGSAVCDPHQARVIHTNERHWAENPGQSIASGLGLVGARGFEPPTTRTPCGYPRISLWKFGTV